MQITFIQNPPYIVDFKKFEPEAEINSSRGKACRVAKRTFELIAIFFIALKDATLQTGRNLGKSFKYTVLGYYDATRTFNFPANLYVAVLKLFFWVFQTGWSVTSGTATNFYNKAFPNSQTPLKLAADKDINLKHLELAESELDASQVPKELKVDHLLKMFDEINFDDPQKPGYMPPLSRVEGGGSPIPSDKLKEALNTFVKRVNTREAFIGTPPGSDTNRLFDFYQQIENAVRLASHKVEGDLKAFEAKNGDKSSNEYKDILENRARLAIDLAIAGSHCGARYMGDAMQVYYSFCKEDAASSETLGEQLLGILANKRKEIAAGEIQNHFGTDVHAFTKYMAALGGPLGIPGTKNVIEQLTTLQDQNKYIKSFFEQYTPDTIIDTIQDEIKNPKSNAFRNKVCDWIKDQMGDWNKAAYEKMPAEIIEKVQPLIEEKVDTTKKPYVEQFIELVEHLKGLNIEIKGPQDEEAKTDNPWKDLVDEIFTLKPTRDWLDKELGKTLPAKKLQRDLKSAMRGDLDKASTLPSDLKQKLEDYLLKDTPLDKEEFRNWALAKQKMAKIRKEVSLPEETIDRILKGETSLSEAVHSHCERERSEEFFTALCNKESDSEGLFRYKRFKDVLELFSHVVSKGILIPNIGQEGADFVTPLFKGHLVSDWVGEKYFTQNPNEQQARIEELSAMCTESALGKTLREDLRKYLNGEEFDKTQFLEEYRKEHHIELDQGKEVQDFTMENMSKLGASKAVLEWLLVSHNILLPQSP